MIDYKHMLKNFTVIILVAMAILIPVQPLFAAGCIESATKSIITAGVAGLGLLVLDCFFFGCLFTATTVGVGSVALGAAAVKGAAVAGAYGCADATLWNRATHPAQPAR